MKLRPTRRPLGLRARLTLSYALFFALLLLGVGWLFRQTLRNIQLRDAEALVAQDWAAAKGHLAIRKNTIYWTHDREDQEVERVIKNLQTVFLLAESDGHPLLMSESYRSLAVEESEVLQWLNASTPQDRLRRGRDGVLYLVRSGPHLADQQRYVLSIGRSLEANERVLSQFTQTYFTGIPLMLLGVAGLGWLMAGRALAPVKDVARAAGALSGENLGVRLAKRGAADELDELVSAFNNMADRLESSFTQVRQFSVDASHELRTPLTAVRSQLEVALITAKTPEQYREAIMTAIEDVEQLSLVVKALLHLAQAESGQVVLTREPVAMRELVGRVAEQFQFPAEAEGIHLETELEDCTVVGDRVQLQRMISNLLSNALKYTARQGGVTVTLRRSEGGSVDLSVSDTGVGIAAEHIPHIFDRFYRVHEASRSGERGLGLGLSFVSWIAKVHAARIAVSSEPGRGTRFTISFPAPDPSLLAQQQQQQAGADSAAATARMYSGKEWDSQLPAASGKELSSTTSPDAS